MRQVKISRAGYQQSSAKPSSFIPQAWSNVFCREFPIMSSWGDECDCVRGLCLHACVCPVCDWSSSRLFSSVQYALRYAEMRHKYGWIKRSMLSNPAFTMESLITHGCVLGVCVSETVRFEIQRPRMFLCTFTCLLLTDVGGAKAVHYMSDIFFFSLSGHASPYRDGRMSSVILRPPWWFIEGVHGCMTCSLISGTINEWLEIKWRIKERGRSERTVESRKLSFSISEKNPQRLSFNPSWQGWGSIHLSLSFSPSSSGSVGSCSGGATAWVLRSVFCVLRDTHTEGIITMPHWTVKADLILCVLEACLPRLHRRDCT